MKNLSLLFFTLCFLAAQPAISLAKGKPVKTTDSSTDIETTTTTKKGGGGKGKNSSTTTADTTDTTDTTTTDTTTTDTATTNQRPVTKERLLTVFQDVAYGGFLHATDVEGDPLTFNLVTQPSKGTITYFDESTGYFIYTPNPAAQGFDGFTFKALDPSGESNETVIDIDIPINDVACEMGKNYFLNDTDGDGFGDMIETVYASDINLRSSKPDLTQNVSFDIDRDLDGIVDYIEVWLGSDPLNDQDTPTDSDLDGVPNCFEPISDGFAPHLLSVGWDKTVIDVSAGDAYFPINGAVSDNAAGTVFAQIQVRGPGPDYSTASFYNTIIEVDVASVKTVSLFDDFPTNYYAGYGGFLDPYMPEGEYVIYMAILKDPVGNKRYYKYDELQAAGLPLTIQVKSLNDTTPPVIESVSIANNNYDLSTGPTYFVNDFSASDDKSGLKYFGLGMTSPSGHSIRSNANINGDMSTSGTATSSVSFNKYAESGEWLASGMTAIDKAGNTVFIPRSEMLDMGINLRINVTNPLSDPIRPDINDIRVLTPLIEPAVDTQIVVEVDISDNLSGIEFGRMTLGGPSGQEIQSSANYSTHVTNGTKTFVFPVHENLENGDWVVKYVTFRDAAMNYVLVSNITTPNLGGFVVYRP